jgi:tetratricopeptide (TPR) repeat protein
MRLPSALLVAVLVTTACAARATRVPSTANEQAAADELVRQGCYDCLLDARAIYERIPASARRPLLLRMLEVELLLALREKELALDTTATMARANAIVSELGPAADVARYVPIVEAVPPDAAGTPRSRRLLPILLAGREGLEAAVGAIEASPFTPLFRQYVRIAVQCGRPPLDPQPRSSGLAAEERRQAVPGDRADTAPLLIYREAMCENPIEVTALEQVRTTVPRFIETGLFLGRAAMSSLFGSDGSRARIHLEEAYSRFPDSPAVTFQLATVTQATGDCRRAEGYFTETLTLRDDHEDARLGRAICRTYLSNNEGAIADATVLVDAATSNRAEAFYWRAWNRRAQKQIEMARSDIDSSRALLYNARVLTLAGMIEHDQAEFDKAKEDLDRAREMDASECQARWYLGLVGYATERWAESAAGFGDAANCYERLIAENEVRRDAMAKRDDVAADFKLRQIAGFEAAIKEDSTQKSAADLNAAINYGRAGDVDRATTYMKRAWVDPERRTAIEDLRQVLGVPRW